MAQTLPPFHCTYTSDLPELLLNLGCSLILSTYQAGKVIILSPHLDGEGLAQLPRNFDKPMGLAVEGPRLAVATRREVMVLANAPELAPVYPTKPDWYDSLFMPRAVYFCGELDLHDLAWSGETLWAVNTRFSCLGQISQTFSFRPSWQPSFVSQLKPEDRCHLNGLALIEGEPGYVTALGRTDTFEGWRSEKATEGVLIHVSSKEIVLTGLAMPHSPRWFDGQLYLLLSATGEVVTVDLEQGRYEVVCQVPGFCRGLAAYGDYLFVGLSRLRKSNRFSDLPIAKREPFCGVAVIHRPTGRIAGTIRYLTSAEEIYDVQALPGLRRPGILGPDHSFVRQSVILPGQAFWHDAQEDLQ